MQYEYLLKIKEKEGKGYLYNDWLTLLELVELEGCTVTLAAIQNRLHSESGVFNSLEDCIFKGNQNVKKPIKIEKNRYKKYLKTPEIKTQMTLSKYWKPTSVSNDALIMQSKEL